MADITSSTRLATVTEDINISTVTEGRADITNIRTVTEGRAAAATVGASLFRSGPRTV